MEKITTRLQNKYHKEPSEKQYGSPTTKDLRKPYSFRWVGEAETQRQGVERHVDTKM